MDPRGHPGPLPDGATCTACGAAVPAERITILARRDDLAFVELDCPACRSTALGLLIDPATPGGAPVLDVSSDATTATDDVRTATLRPISAADVEAIRADLAAWDGDLVGWLDALEDSGRPGSVIDR